ncbi:SURF1 family protein [Novosphingobium album (ex Liu et al. 2023)]|uniref:SURF1-like protein n=1 Tax=Novosphingobium album (ex Liu et al. 2023) TaxID=3031130 RepID=A0ABT5WSB3_9SPHN|nr:SURF1 family protein [Novosphingobium album (ex Liu et al. 2023)]MDE8652929.1 SURF1 family protein [Novosphingobium album (ex Liu et al. 2023)]
MRRVPVFATLLVLAAVATMIALGFWQIRRLHEKEALLAHYAAAQATSAEVPWPADAQAAQAALYRHARVLCGKVLDRTSIAGRSARGEAGVAQVADCALPGGGTARVVLGWSRQPAAGLGWQGGEVRGILAPGPRLVADPPLAGLEANAPPDPAEIPNNHLAYAVQWFLFALTALVIYALALRKRWNAAPGTPRT